MERIILITSRIFNSIFVDNSYNNSTLMETIIYNINSKFLLYVGFVFTIIGFTIGVIKRLIRS